MRKSTLLLAIGVAVGSLATTAVLADQNIQPLGVTPKWTMPPVLLSGDDALARLRISNPRHYAIAVQILAAADEICGATKASPIPTKFEGGPLRAVPP